MYANQMILDIELLSCELNKDINFHVKLDIDKKSNKKN
jgi:hypothetical protein